MVLFTKDSRYSGTVELKESTHTVRPSGWERETPLSVFQGSPSEYFRDFH